MSVELYDSQHPQAAKWLLPDGTVTYKLPIMGAADGSGGGGGTFDHAELVNLDYAHSGHTGFASQADLNAIANMTPETGVMVSHEFSPGLSICRTNYGNVYHYWIEGEAAYPRSIPSGTFLATPTQFPELALFQGTKLSVLFMAYRFVLMDSNAPPQIEFDLMNISKKGIQVVSLQGTHFNCIDADINSYGGTNITFSQTLVLGAPN